MLGPAGERITAEKEVDGNDHQPDGDFPDDIPF
jgi:hypothetical protein